MLVYENLSKLEEKFEDIIFVSCGTWEPLDPYKQKHFIYFENQGYFWSKDVKHKPVWMRNEVYCGKWVSILDNSEEFHKQLGKKCSSNNAGDGPKSEQENLRRVLGNITNAIENWFSVLKSRLQKKEGLSYNYLQINTKILY